MAGDMPEFYAHSREGVPPAQWQNLEDHLLETADLARRFATAVGLPSVAELGGLLHDLGKYSNAFQMYVKSAEGKREPDAEPAEGVSVRGKVDHSTAGAQLVWNIMKDRDAVSRLLAQVISLCIASHHSGLIDCLSPDGEGKFLARISKKLEQTHLEEVRDTADREIVSEFQKLADSPELLAELKNQLKHVLSGEPSTEIREFYVGLLVRFLFSALVDADRLSAAGRASEFSTNPRNQEWNRLVERLESHIVGIPKGNWVDEIRVEISMACREFASRDKGLYKLTVPTGGGKTLSSLRFALRHANHHRMNRVIYVIPYISIIDQSATLIRSVLEHDAHEKGVVVLEHHSNLTPDKQAWQASLLAENWDAPVIFTTSVQFLETLFGGGTRAVRRMHQLANAVIIFDEIQTVPLKTVHLFNNAINFLVKECSSTVVFCTATQPLLETVDKTKGAARLTDKPEMAPHHEQLFEQLRRVNVLDRRKTGGWNEDEIAELVCQEASEAGSALVVVNTKVEARAIYTLSRRRLGNAIHLSTNMCPAHRMRIIWWLKRRLAANHGQSEPLVCVSTQLIEAGVDLDFGAVVRYLAGLESIGQAAGRCNRNGRHPSGNVTIVNPSGEDLAMLPEIAKGRAIAERVLDEYRTDPGAFNNNLVGPKAMNQYYEYYFYERSREMVYPVSAREVGHDDNMLSLLSTNGLSAQAYASKHNSAPDIPLQQSFKSAGSAFEVIDAPTEGILVPYGRKGKRIISELCAARRLEETRQLLRKAQRYSVNVFPHDKDKLTQAHRVHETQPGSGILYLEDQYYHDEVGIMFDDKNLMGFLNA